MVLPWYLPGRPEKGLAEHKLHPPITKTHIHAGYLTNMTEMQK